MKCPICSSEIPDDAVACDKCGAHRVTQRTPAGVVAGWLGLTMATLWGMMWLFLFALLLVGYDIEGFPWLTLFLGTAITVGLLWYSRSTLHVEWERGNRESYERS